MGVTEAPSKEGRAPNTLEAELTIVTEASLRTPPGKVSRVEGDT